MAETEYFVLQSRTNETFGPLKEEEVRQWIREERIGKLDSVTKTGNTDWIPLPYSEFQPDLSNQIAMQQMAAATCPNCNAAMVVIVGARKADVWWLIIGIVTSGCVLGIPIFIWALYRYHTGKGRSYYQCPRCKFTTR
jgi:hypothetical protein